MQASFHITIYKERGTVSMKKYVVIIDLHCDPTIPSGSGDSGGGKRLFQKSFAGVAEK